MAFIIFGVTRVIICAVEICLWVIYHDSGVSPILRFYWSSARMGWRLIRNFFTWLICRVWLGSAAIFWVSWRISMWGWPSMWCVTAKTASQSTPVVVSTVSMMWPGMASVGVVMTVTLISVEMGLWPWYAVSVSVLVTVSRSISCAMSGVWILSMMMGRCAWGWYPLWTVHHYMTIFLALEALYIWTMMCYVT